MAKLYLLLFSGHHHSSGFIATAVVISGVVNPLMFDRITSHLTLMGSPRPVFAPITVVACVLSPHPFRACGLPPCF